MAGENELELQIRANVKGAETELDRLFQKVQSGGKLSAQEMANLAVTMDRLEKEVNENTAANQKFAPTLDVLKAKTQQLTQAEIAQTKALDEVTKRRQAARQGLDDLGRSIGLPVGELGKLSLQMAVAAGAMQDLKAAADSVNRSLSETGPSGKVVGEAISAILDPTNFLSHAWNAVMGTFEQARASLDQLADRMENTEGATRLLGRSLEDLGEKAKSAAAIRDLAQDLRGNEEALKAQTTLLLDTIEKMDKFGGISKSVAVELSERLNKAVREFKEALLPVPADLLAAAEAFKQYGEESKKALADTPPELEKIGKAAKEELPKVTEEADKAAEATKRLQAQLKATADEAKKAFDAANQQSQGTAGNLEDIAARRQELEGKPLLDADELNELNDLKQKQIDTEKELADGLVKTELAAIDLDRANQQLSKSTGGVTDALGDLFANVDGSEELFGSLAKNKDAIADLSEITGHTVNETDLLAQSLNNIGERLETVASSGQPAAEAVAEVAEETETATESAEEYLKRLQAMPEESKKAGEAVVANFVPVKDTMVEIRDLLKEIKAELAGIGA